MILKLSSFFNLQNDEILNQRSYEKHSVVRCDVFVPYGSMDRFGLLTLGIYRADKAGRIYRAYFHD